MLTSSSSPALQIIDSIAIAIAQGYILARARLTSHPSPVMRLAAVRDAIAWDAALLERELAVFRQERERIQPKQRPHYTPTHRLEILQIVRLRQWSADDAAMRFVFGSHPRHGSPENRPYFRYGRSGNWVTVSGTSHGNFFQGTHSRLNARL